MPTSGEVLDAERFPGMNADETAQLQLLIDCLQHGDDSARRELISHAYERLRLLARTMLYTAFPRLHNLHATGSVLDEAARRLLTALQQVTVHTVHGRNDQPSDQRILDHGMTRSKILDGTLR
jgi:hypothetical protein